MANNIKTSIILDLAGNLSRKARQYETSLRRFSSAGNRHLASLRSQASQAGRAIDRMGNRWTALATGAGATAGLRYVIGMEQRITRLGIQANKSADEMNRLKREIFDISQEGDIRIDPSQIIGAVEAIVEKTGDLEFAQNNIRNIGLAIQATGAQGGAIGEILAEFQKMGIKAPAEVLKAIDVLNVQGKEGAFTLQNLAALGPRVVTAYTSLGRTGVPALREMGAALQVIRQGTGSSEMAATAFEAVLRTLSDPAKVKLLTGAGIQLFEPDALKEGKEVLRPINELMVEIIKATGGRKTVLGKVFDAEAVRSFNAALAEFNRTGGVASMDKFMNVQADGTTTIQDSARAAKTASSALTSLFNVLKKLADEKLTGPIQSIADALNSMNPDAIERVFKVLATGAAGVIGLSIAAKGVRAIGSLTGRNNPAAGGGMPGVPAGVQPVYVVNFPGVPGASSPGAGSGKGNPGSRAGFVKSGLLVGGAGLAGYGVGTLIDKTLQQSEGGLAFRDKIGAAIASVLADFGNETAKGAIDADLKARQDLGGTLNIKIDQDGRARVTSIEKKGALDFDVDAGMTMVTP